MYKIKYENGFKYIEEGEGDILLLLHGLFGELSNWDSVINFFCLDYRIIIPIFPIYEKSIKNNNLNSLINFLDNFIKFKKISFLTLIGNSLGGHLLLLYILKKPFLVKRIILTGSSGLFENFKRTSFPRRSDYNYIKNKIGYTFFSSSISDKVNIDSVFSMVKNIDQVIRIISVVRSVRNNNISRLNFNIKIPILLVWGINDTITPSFVVHQFNNFMDLSTLKFIENCCHAPMMEHPIKFNNILKDFLINNP